MKKYLKPSVVILFVVLFALGSIQYFYLKNISGVGPLTKAKTVMIEKGASLKSIARHLEEQGFIDSPKLFLITARVMQKGNKLQAGEIKIPAYSSIIEIIELLSNAKSVQYRITIPEGLTTYQVLELISNEENLSGSISIDVKEGELFPETYLYSRGDSKNRLIERMIEAMKVNIDKLWDKRDDDLPYKTKAEAVIMASLIEKETSVKSEYDIIAGVFINRLHKRMRLQTDPTVIYALSDGKGYLGRTLLRKDLSVKHPYNTYKIYGLPPGPICNPGLRALKASLRPKSNQYLYFVADGTGGHAFAQTLNEHNRNVANWKQVRKQKRIEAKQQALAEKAMTKPLLEDELDDEDAATATIENDNDILEEDEIEDIAVKLKEEAGSIKEKIEEDAKNPEKDTEEDGTSTAAEDNAINTDVEIQSDINQDETKSNDTSLENTAETNSPETK
ncbi:MAG: endolytic transglycosylase MltG [Alphaproteobacteria bacterium]